jgi:YVTN family beta-propeller protein
MLSPVISGGFPMQQTFRAAFRSHLVLAALVACTFAATPPAHAQQPYRILDRWTLPEPGGWDYVTVDSAAHRLYITRGDHVDVLDTASGKLTGTIGNLGRIHGVALDTAGQFGYISDAGTNTVVVFDRATLATLASIPAGTGPDGITFEPATQTVWAFNGRSHDATVIDAATRKVVATIALPGKPESAAVDGTGILYNNIEDKNQIVRLDAHSLKMTATWDLKDCESPSGLAFDTAGHRLFPVCDGKKMGVVDSLTGASLATATIGDGPDAAGWSAAHKLAFASCGEGVLSVVDAGSPGYKTIQTLATQSGARTMAYDAAADRIYLITATFGPRPAATPENPRPPMIPGTFTVLVIGR